MIMRIWSARAGETGAEAYRNYFEQTLLPELNGLPGFRGGYLAGSSISPVENRPQPEASGTLVELTTYTLWESWDALERFSHGDPTVSVVEPEARAFLTEIDPTVLHRTVLVDGRA